MGYISSCSLYCCEGYSYKKMSLVKPKRLTFVINNLSCGGAERVCANLSNELAERGYEITVLTLEPGEDFFSLSEKVIRKRIDFAQQMSFRFYKRLFMTRRMRYYKGLGRWIEETKPDLIISFITVTNISVLLGCSALRIPIVITEHCDPMENENPDTVWQDCQKYYNLCDALVVLNQGMKDYYSKFVIPDKVRLFVNPVVETLPQKNQSDLSLAKPCFISIGRLDYAKGFDVLIRSFSEFRKIYPHWFLYILGEGAERKALTLLINELGLQDHVFLPGSISNVYEWLFDADIFVLSSRNESFAIALYEAMVCGLPVISTKFHNGDHEYVNDGYNGVLAEVEDPISLLAAMIRLANDEDLRKRIGANAKKVYGDVKLEKVANDWEMLFTDIMEMRKGDC